jgi:16S rRNA (cytosine967-C5)-methyltransferase
VPVTSLDVRPAALAELRKRARRAGARVRTVELADDGPVPVPAASRVLVDAPCTGSGVLRRHPELRWTYRLRELLPLQVAILDRAATVVRPGGRLIYATCSVLREEDEDQADAFLARHPGWTRVRELRTWPHVDGCDGFYAAVLARPA